MKFNEKLKSLRISNNMTQEDLAKEIDKTEVVISAYEEGTIEPSIDILIRLSLIFKVSLEELVGVDEIKGVNQEEKQIKLEKRFFVLNTAIFLIFVLVTPILILMMKDVVPLNYNFLGEITRYGSKWEMILILLSLLIPYVISAFLYTFNSRKNQEVIKSFMMFQIIIFISQLILLGFYLWMGFSNVEKIKESIIPSATAFLIIIFFVLSIFSMPKFNSKINVWFGFRTQFTLSNEDAWRKINFAQSISGIIATAVSYLTIIFTFKPWNIFLTSCLILSMIPSFIYHEILRKRANNK